MKTSGTDAAFVQGTSIVEGSQIYSSGPYSVYVGKIVGPLEKGPDMDHYLVINDVLRVVELSTNRLVDARAAAWALDQAGTAQMDKINGNLPLIEQEGQPDNAQQRHWN